MAQFARPESDIDTTGWTTQAGGGTNLYDVLDETSANDADYARAGNPHGNTLKVYLSPVTDPQSSTGHIVRYRIGKLGTGVISFTVSLRQGSTAIASWPHIGVATGPTTYTQTLSADEANAITNYADLYLWFTATSGGELQLFGLLLGRT